MGALKKRFEQLWILDPGGFQLRHATKTILAILCALYWTNQQPAMVQLVAAVTTGFAMQGIVAKTGWARFGQVLVFDSLYFLSFFVGLVVRDAVYWSAFVLVGLGFLVNYVRRFRLETSTAPMGIWTLCFLATILPFPPTSSMHEHLYGVGVGLLVSSGVTILFFPENYSRLFVKNSNQFLRVLAQGMREVRAYLVFMDSEHGVFEQQSFMMSKVTLAQLMDANQTLQQQPIFAHHEQQIDVLVTHQYAIYNAYSLMLDAYQLLWGQRYVLSRARRLMLSRMMRDLERHIAASHMSDTYQVYSLTPLSVLTQFTEKFVRIRTRDQTLILALLNLKLSFSLLEQHLRAYIGSQHGT